MIQETRRVWLVMCQDVMTKMTQAWFDLSLLLRLFHCRNMI
jgi:hypothetical protein